MNDWMTLGLLLNEFFGNQEAQTRPPFPTQKELGRKFQFFLDLGTLF